MFRLITKSDCPWCDKAKELLKEKEAPFGAFDYQEHPMIVKLLFQANLKTLPQIWHNGEHIGGYENLVKWLEKNEP